LTARPYRVEFERQAAKALAELPLDTQRRLARAIDSLARDPRPTGCKKLEGGDDLFRIRVGDYRVIYQVIGRQLLVLVLKVGHRRDAYRRQR
jgi:mRNA interferase RelE/StbE